MKTAILLLVSGLSLASTSTFASRNDVVEGNRASVVKLIIYEDLQSDLCSRFESTLEQKVLPKYGTQILVIHRDFPQAKHDWARQAAVAARWVWEQDSEHGIEIRRELMSEQDHITSANLAAWLAGFAARNHLNPKDIVDSIKDQRLNTLVDQDRQAAVARGITSTPTVYVGGVSFTDPIIFDDLARALDEAVAK